MTKRLVAVCLVCVSLLSACHQKASQPKPVSSGSSQREVKAPAAKSDQTSPPSSPIPAGRTETNPPMTAETIEQITPAALKRQLSVLPQIQEKAHYCVPATVSMILSSRGISVSQDQLAQAMGTYLPFGTHNRDGIRVLNRYLFGYETPSDGQAGYRLETVTDVAQQLPAFKDRLVKNIADGYPMYYTLDLSKVYTGLFGEHNVIGVGYALTADETDIALIYYIDPLAEVQDPTQKGLKVMTPEQLLTAIVSCQEPHYAW